jgi:hypothetical protein
VKLPVCYLAAGALLVASSPAVAQETPSTYAMATYYRCSQADAPRADTIVKEHVIPFLKSEQAAGRISAYGWSEHREGGDWRRLMYVVGTDLGKLADSRDAMTEALGKPEHAKAFEEFTHICGSHNDYIWRSVTGSQSMATTAQNRSSAMTSMSTYFVCNAHEGEADAIVKSALAPIMNNLVKNGTINNWGWEEHIFGGVFRRLLIIDGKDEKSLLTNWATMNDAFEKAAPELAQRFTEICDSHSDYIWQLVAN